MIDIAVILAGVGVLRKSGRVMSCAGLASPGTPVDKLATPPASSTAPSPDSRRYSSSWQLPSQLPSHHTEHHGHPQ
ncbi:MAG TPA: hypothetical protein VG276_09545, partial [Actinomycetes bacterium]|nr:hypothetical protein [Actinomycetes bacterium]